MAPLSARNLLFLVHRVPYPPNRGDRIRSYNILRELASRYNVYLATLADEDVTQETLQYLHDICREVTIAPLGGIGRWVRGACSMATGRSATEGLFRSPRLETVLRNWMLRVRFDAAFVFCSSMLQYLKPAEFSKLPAIVDLVDVDSQKWIDYARLSSGPKKWLLQLEGHRLRRLEREVVKRATAVSLVSEPESALLRRIAPNDRTMAVRNGVDFDYFRSESAIGSENARRWLPLPSEQRSDLVFVGALDYRANIDGLTWFANAIWPMLRQRLPNITLNIVGRNPAPGVSKLADAAGICVVGGVPDVRPFLHGARIAIAPLRVARGVQNKILEAMSMGCPVVATPGAVEGLDCIPSQDVIVVEHAAEWADSVPRLLRDERLLAEIGSCGRRYAEARHCWKTTLSPLIRRVEAEMRETPTHEDGGSPEAREMKYA